MGEVSTGGFLRKEKGESVPYSHALFDVCGAHPLTELNNEFGYLLDVDDIFALFGVLLVLYYLRTPGYLEGVVFGHSLPVCCDVP